MMNRLQEYCTKNKDYIPANKIEEGDAYAVLRDDGIYYRFVQNCGEQIK